MLSIDVYQEMYHLAQKVEQNTTILEIGTAHGAGTISLALGSQGKNRIASIDKITGGGAEINLAHLKKIKSLLKIISNILELKKLSIFILAHQLKLLLTSPKSLESVCL